MTKGSGCRQCRIVFPPRSWGYIDQGHEPGRHRLNIVSPLDVKLHCRIPFSIASSLFFLFVCVALAAQDSPSGAAKQPGIQDNSFLMEEAYNQEFGVVQHISGFIRFWNSKDWAYTFTQEWPVPGDPRHQFSYTLPFQHAGDFSRSGSGIGDVLLNYRYQVAGNGESRVAFAPRLSLILPTGDTAAGRGSGGFGLQTNVAASVFVLPKLVTHWNLGATFIPHAKDSAGDRASSAGYNLGQSFIWLAHRRFNVMLETVFFSTQQVIGHDKVEWDRALYLNPGFRWAYNFSNGLQIVPGVAVPIGVGPSAGEKAILLYLSFEHPFRKIPKK
jgi:hypothetical protein